MTPDSLPDTFDDEEAEAETTGPDLQELHDELAAATAEWRRGSRRTLDVLKEFGGALEAVGGMVRDLHHSSRQAPSPAPAASASPDESLLALIDLADRLARLSEAFTRPPAAASSFWPPARRALAGWQSAWSAQAEACAILRAHAEDTLARSGLRRLDADGALFDPAAMTAVETIIRPDLPDHTVVAVLVPGWRHLPTARILRPAQVRVSRVR